MRNNVDYLAIVKNLVVKENWINQHTTLNWNTLSG